MDILQGAGNDVDFGNYNISAQSAVVGTGGLTVSDLSSTRVPFLNGSKKLVDHGDLTYDSATSTLSVPKLSGFTATGAIDFNTQPMTNVNIDSGSLLIDGSSLSINLSNCIIYSNANNYLDRNDAFKYDDAYGIVRINSLYLDGPSQKIGVDPSLNASLELGNLTGTTTITFPDTTGNVITSGDSSTVTNTMLSGSIENDKLLDISSNDKVWGSAITMSASSGIESDSTHASQGLHLKNALAGSGLTWNDTGADQVIDVSFGNVSALEISGNGIALKDSLAGSGLSWNNTGSDQVLDLSPSNITSVGTLTGLEVSGDAVFTTMAETLNSVSGTNVINYTNGSVIWFTPSGLGPFAYDLSGIPNIDTQSHVITVITKSNGNATCYADTVTVNGTSYNLLWNSGSLPELDTVAGDIITQQFSILPSNLDASLNILTNVSYYKTAS